MEEKITTVPMSALHPHPRNAEFFDDADPDSFAKLKDSIAELGLLTPLRVSKDYTIISGHSHQPFDKVWADSDRDYWMTAEEAKEYGMVDEVLVRKG